MFKVYAREIEWGGRKLRLETGRLARQADGAVLVTYGDTVVLCTAVAKKEAKEDQGFFPLTVNYIEKYYAAGRIPGGFFKREARPSERETLLSRLIDRPIRPLFPENFLNETQVICTVLNHDMINDPDIPAIIGASAALTISGIPFYGPLAGVKVGMDSEGNFILNPTLEQRKSSLLDLIIAGSKTSVLMVESEAQELSEDQMLKALEFGHQSYQPVLDLIISLAEESAKEPWDLPEVPAHHAAHDKMQELLTLLLTEAYKGVSKTERSNNLDNVKKKVFAQMVEEGFDETILQGLFDQIQYHHVRNMILETGKRIDGRSSTDIRSIWCDVGLLPNTHGTGLFNRGETQVLAITTLGTADDEQLIDSLEGESYENFMLHYNFPSFSVGEVGRLGSPGRREIGHGRLAWRAIHPMMPAKEEFPYTVRVVSEVLTCNGSSSMGTVCASVLSLMDAGVPLKKPVAGIAMGLVAKDDKCVVLSDIISDEDFLGDMDFKVTGTKDGVTALQMDLKNMGLTFDLMEKALKQAKDGRLSILSDMLKTLSAPRGTISEKAPRLETIKIHKDKIRDVIGSGGKVIRDICETTGAKIDISEEGVITVSGPTLENVNAAIERIKSIAMDPEVGQKYPAKVVKIVEFGAFVAFMSREGLVHVSEIGEERIKDVNDVLKVGDDVVVTFMGTDDRGKYRLSMRAEPGSPRKRKETPDAE